MKRPVDRLPGHLAKAHVDLIPRAPTTFVVVPPLIVVTFTVVLRADRMYHPICREISTMHSPLFPVQGRRGQACRGLAG